ncbi:MAG: hypothetical protein AAGK17_00590 [Pseudomonadota bacterium]
MLYTVIASTLLAMQAAPETTESVPPPSTPTPAQEKPEVVEAAADAEEANDDNKVVCRRTAVVGSRFTKRRCATKKEWRELTRDAKEKTDAMQRRGKGLDPNGS